MLPLWNAAKLLATSLFCFLLPAAANAAGHDPKPVLIKTFSRGGETVTAKVEMSVGNSAWVPVEGVQVPGGGIEVFVTKCDSSIRFRAFKIDTYGTFTREYPEDPKYCHLPEVVFDDYVSAVSWDTVSFQKLGDKEAWITALGGDTSAKQNGPIFAEKFGDALRSRDFGYVAIASSEVAASLRAAGKFDAAAQFATLSYQSTLVGIVDAKGELADPSKFLVVVPGSDKPVISAKAGEILKQYQVQTLGITAKSAEYGKTGWTTMKSLAVKNIEPAKWKLENGAITNFDAKVFLRKSGEAG